MRPGGIGTAAQLLFGNEKSKLKAGPELSFLSLYDYKIDSENSYGHSATSLFNVLNYGLSENDIVPYLQFDMGLATMLLGKTENDVTSYEGKSVYCLMTGGGVRIVGVGPVNIDTFFRYYNFGGWVSGAGETGATSTFNIGIGLSFEISFED